MAFPSHFSYDDMITFVYCFFLAVWQLLGNHWTTHQHPTSWWRWCLWHVQQSNVAMKLFKDKEQALSTFVTFDSWSEYNDQTVHDANSALNLDLRLVLKVVRALHAAEIDMRSYVSDIVSVQPSKALSGNKRLEPPLDRLKFLNVWRREKSRMRRCSFLMTDWCNS